MDKRGNQTNEPKNKKIYEYVLGIIFEGWYRLYVSRKKGGRGLSIHEDCVDASIQGLDDYIKKNQERLITTANYNISNISRNRKTTKSKKHKWDKKITLLIFKATNWWDYIQEDLGLAA